MEASLMAAPKSWCQAQQCTGISKMKVIEFLFGFLIGIGLWGLTLLVLLILN